MTDERKAWLALSEAMRRITQMAGGNADDYRWYQNAARQAHRAMLGRHREAVLKAVEECGMEPPIKDQPLP